MTARNDYHGSATQICVSDQALSDGEFLVSGTNGTITELDLSAASAKWTSVILVLTATCSADPGTDASVDIYLWETEVDGTNDELAPTVADKKGADWRGSFRVPDDVGTATFYVKEEISTVAVKSAKVSIVFREGENTVDLDSGVTVDVEGFGFNDT